MQNVTKIKLKALTILWHEGTGEFDNKTFTLWVTAQNAFNKIYKNHIKDGGPGYTKVKVKVQWEDGSEITDRLDISNNDFNPSAERLGEFLYKAVNFYTVMYSSNLINRHNLSFSDNDWNDGTWPTETVEPEMDEPENNAKQPQNSPNKSPKNSRKIAVNSAKISRKQPPPVPTYQPAPKQPENSPKTPPKQPVFNLCFEYILELQVNTYLLN
jgi:hypothetical protein